MKKCFYCAEEIQEDAIKCKHCGEFLDGRSFKVEAPEEKLPWYFKSSTLVLAILTVGPLALPLVWFHPKYSVRTKIIVSLVVLVVAYIIGVAIAKALHWFMEYYKTILTTM